MANLHPRAPWKDVAFVGGYWNCGERLEKLLPYAQEWFGSVIAVVQKSDDNTLEVAQKYADIVVEDEWLGHGNPSISKAVSLASSKFIFVISDDEWPTEELLYSFQNLAGELKAQQKDGAWVKFVSTIDGFDFSKEQDVHLRFFRGGIPWPPTQHSRPETDNTIVWRPTPNAFVRHDRTLDEMMRDYLNRYAVGLRDGVSDQQMAHNRAMVRNGCIGVAGHKGWEYVTAFPWWTDILAQAFEGVPPDMTKPEVVSVPRKVRGKAKSSGVKPRARTNKK